MRKSSSVKLSMMVEKWIKTIKKGHFVVYTKEGKRFVMPLPSLNHPIFRVLLEMAEEEFGTTVNGSLQVPCEEEMMDYILSLLRKNAFGEVQEAVVSMTTSCRSGASKFSSLFALYHGPKSAADCRHYVK